MKRRGYAGDRPSGRFCLRTCSVGRRRIHHAAIVFEGNELEINYTTSAAGYVQVELLDAAGKPIPGFRTAECYEIFGDEIARTVVWRKGHTDVPDENHQAVGRVQPSNVGLVARANLSASASS